MARGGEGTAAGALAPIVQEALAGAGAGGDALGIGKPFQQQILLFSDVSVVGTSRLEGGEEALFSLKEGDEIVFERDAGNLHSKNSIKARTAGGAPLGYVCTTRTEPLSHLMDAGKRVFGAVSYVDDLQFHPELHMEVYLDD